MLLHADLMKGIILLLRGFVIVLLNEEKGIGLKLKLAKPLLGLVVICL